MITLAEYEELVERVYEAEAAAQWLWESLATVLHNDDPVFHEFDFPESEIHASLHRVLGLKS